MTRSLHTPLRAVLLLWAAVAAALTATALPVEHYAASSRLASGRWRKIVVAETGMQFISNASLRSMGFTDPSRVNVYGYGNYKISDNLTRANYVDDLPMQPVVRTPDGIIFFGTGTVQWKASSYVQVPFEPLQNPYSTQSVYFLSDREAEPQEMASLPSPPNPALKRQNVFRQRLLHEKELFAPSTTGTWMLGEDFSQNRTQNFVFDLPGIVGTTAGVEVAFGANSPGDDTSISVSANGSQLPSTAYDHIGPTGGVAVFITPIRSVKQVPEVGQRLDLSITYNPPANGGVLYYARLDRITVCYQRRLELLPEGTHFYTESNYNSPVCYEVAGCDASTQIWDVTNPSAPARIEYELSGDTARFTPTSSAYREYVAFRPDGAGIKRYPKPLDEYVANQDIHAMPVPDMVIISPREYTAQAQRIADMHSRLDGMQTIILTPEVIYNEFSSGAPDVSAYRKMLKMWYDRGKGQEVGSPTGSKLKYCLIMGRPSYDNRRLTEKVASAGYPRPLMWQSAANEDTRSQTSSYGTDDFIAMLEDDAGTLNMERAKISIAVGRMPVRFAADARVAVDKLLRYVEQPDYGEWRNRMMIIADNGDAFIHFNQAEDSYAIMRRSGNGTSVEMERFYLSCWPQAKTAKGKEYPEAKAHMLAAWDRGVGFVSYIGHANPREWTHENLLNFTDINGLDNRRLPFFYTATCEFTRFDDDDISAGEIMWASPEAGAIAMISTLRSVFITPNGALTNCMSSHFFEYDAAGRPLGIGEILRRGKNDRYSDDNRLRFLLIGDPAMRIFNPALRVVAETIDSVDVTAPGAELPVLQGGSKVKVSGYIRRGDALASDFNGTLRLTLYDAERVVETIATVEDRTTGMQVLDQKLFNDWSNRIFLGTYRVVNGRWEAEIPVSTNIENNFNPARMVFYAYTDGGEEANGSTEAFRVFGLADVHDATGPEITSLTLNPPVFTPGQQVSANPVLYATFRDENGINISTAGIGHTLVARLDDNTYFSDLHNYYYTDPDDNNAGGIAYPLTDLAPGRHTLELTVYDNHSNRSQATIDFVVTVSPKPILYDVSTDANPARTSVTFTLAHDRLREATECSVEVFDLTGRKLWTGSRSGRADLQTGASLTWDLRDGSGRRVPRGIYLYRASVRTSDGVSVSRAYKLAVAAE